MKLSSILGALGTGATLLKGASTAAIVFGAVYLVDCRLTDKDPGGRDRCYFTAGTLMGLGGMSGVGYAVGFNTFNPALRKPEDQDGGLFKRRQP
jgi:hypothetical protein